MEASLMKSEIHQFIDKADEQFLSLIHGLITAKREDKTYMIPDEELTLMEERLLDYERNPTSGSSWDEVKARLLSK
jgi:hypothetical protein